MPSMEGPSEPQTRLQVRTTDADSLFKLPDEEYLNLIRGDFAPELERLKRAYSVRDHNFTPPAKPSPSRILFGEDYDEVNRTLVGVLTLRWLHNGQYEALAGAQPGPVRLERASFDWMRTFIAHIVTTPADLYALLTAVVINDLGKDKQLASDCYDATGEDVSSLNHDMILLKAVNADLVPCLDRLPSQHRSAVVHGLQLGAEFNFGQLAQAENAPACLASLLSILGKRHAFDLHFAEQLLDVAGAGGHMDWAGAKRLTEPVFDAFRNVYDAATGVIDGNCGLRVAYDLILVRRAEMLQKRGWRKRLDVRDAEQRALLRVFCMGGVADGEKAALFEKVWDGLEEEIRRELVKALNVDGSAEEPAVQPTYMPALLAQVVAVGSEGKSGKMEEALRSALCYLARVMRLEKVPEGPVNVVERSVLGVLKEVVQSPRFRADPSILETAPVPRSVAAIMTERWLGTPQTPPHHEKVL